jgi:hypothetical protein
VRHLLASLFLVALVGCGNERFEPKSFEVDPEQEGRTIRYPNAGVTVDLPRGFGVVKTPSPGVFRATLGESFVSIFAYRRAEQLPRDESELRTARRRLERAVKARSRGWRQRSARTTRIAGARTLELVGDQTLSQQRLRTRSLHVFKGSVEYVIEVVAPVRGFARVDRAVTPTLKRTLKLTGKVRKPPRRRARR